MDMCVHAVCKSLRVCLPDLRSEAAHTCTQYQMTPSSK